MKTKRVGRQVFRLVVAHVKSKDAFDRPKRVEFLYDEDSVDLKGGEEFWTVLLPEEATQPQTKGRA